MPALDFYSRAFDPLRALYDPHVVPPRPGAAPLDSVSRCSALLPEWMLPPDLGVKLRKRLEEADSGVRAAVRELANQQARDARESRLAASRRSRLAEEVAERLSHASAGSAAAGSLAVMADRRDRVMVVMTPPACDGDPAAPAGAWIGRASSGAGPGAPADGASGGQALVVWVGTLLLADAQWNLMLGGAMMHLVGRADAGGARAPAPASIDPATGRVQCGRSGALGAKCWRSLMELSHAAQAATAGPDRRQQVVLRGAAVLSVQRL